MDNLNVKLGKNTSKNARGESPAHTGGKNHRAVVYAPGTGPEGETEGNEGSGIEQGKAPAVNGGRGRGS